MESLNKIHICQPPEFVAGQKLNLKGQMEDIQHQASELRPSFVFQLCGDHIHPTSLLFTPQL